ncbi:hypothetical protein E2C01_082918 [Portunus trituberculatus]|uniref:Uncharacterized protein n=1 Tax=Portunus trituberculatus TaxID=210409 RepID=A0A5B7J0D0_PORTR|nr:hypothetical protein [Portunus trituberculatus]
MSRTRLSRLIRPTLARHTPTHPQPGTRSPHPLSAASPRLNKNEARSGGGSGGGGSGGGGKRAAQRAPSCVFSRTNSPVVLSWRRGSKRGAHSSLFLIRAGAVGLLMAGWSEGAGRTERGRCARVVKDGRH